jgi:hypothetical protein
VFRNGRANQEPKSSDQPIPSDFPRLRTGAVITVGAMQGTLSAQ